MVLGLIGVPSAEITYSAFRAAVQAGGVFGAELAAAEALAVAGIVGAGAAIVGTGLAGIAIGQAILRGLEYTGAEPPQRQLYKVPAGQGRVGVVFEFELTNGTPHPQYVEVEAPFVGVLAEMDSSGERVNYFLLQSDGVKVGLLLAGPGAIITVPYIVSVTKLSTGQPAESFKQPSYEPKPLAAPLKRPAVIPFGPQFPDYPITPTVVPPAEVPEKDKDKERVPGLTVQIPETGLQVQFTPTGVRVSGYSDPTTTPFEFPEIAKPPTDKKVAAPPCPCPEPPQPPSSNELLCRVKALQKGLLDDGYLYSSHAGASGNSGTVNVSTDVLVSVKLVLVPNDKATRVQPGNGGAPDIYYAGWLSFIVNGGNTNRVPVHYATSAYIAPEGASGYTFTITEGATASSEYITRKTKDFIDLC